MKKRYHLLFILSSFLFVQCNSSNYEYADNYDDLVTDDWVIFQLTPDLQLEYPNYPERIETETSFEFAFKDETNYYSAYITGYPLVGVAHPAEDADSYMQGRMDQRPYTELYRQSRDLQDLYILEVVYEVELSEEESALPAIRHEQVFFKDNLVFCIVSWFNRADMEVANPKAAKFINSLKFGQL